MAKERLTPSRQRSLCSSDGIFDILLAGDLYFVTDYRVIIWAVDGQWLSARALTVLSRGQLGGSGRMGLSAYFAVDEEFCLDVGHIGFFIHSFDDDMGCSTEVLLDEYCKQSYSDG